MTAKSKEYFVARAELLRFFDNLDGSFEQFARATGISARTVARVRKENRVSRDTANRIYKAAASLGMKLPKEKVFKKVEEE